MKSPIWLSGLDLEYFADFIFQPSDCMHYVVKTRGKVFFLVKCAHCSVLYAVAQLPRKGMDVTVSLMALLYFVNKGTLFIYLAFKPSIIEISNN